MRMRDCPHCGEANSVKRDTCYQCQQPLAPVGAGATGRDAPPAAAGSRWEALEPTRGARPRRDRGAPSRADSSRAAAGPAGRAAPRRRYVPAMRSGLAHVRRMGIFFRELHMLSYAGRPIAEACRELSQRAPRQLRPIAREMAEAAESGQPISSAMQRRPNIFYPWHLGVVRAAETVGLLPQAFRQIAEAYENEWETRAAFLVPLALYGIFGLPAALAAIPVIMTLAQPIPENGWTPSLVIDTTMRNARAVCIPVAVGLICFIVVWQLLGATAWFQTLQQRVAIRLPFIGNIARRAALERYAATLGLMLRAGVPVALAAEEAALAAGHAALTPRLLDAASALRSGARLSQALAQAGVFGRETLGMIATGDESGETPDMLERVASYYRQENEGAHRIVRRASWAVVGGLWSVLAGAIVIIGFRTYVGYIFRIDDWMRQ